MVRGFSQVEYTVNKTNRADLGFGEKTARLTVTLRDRQAELLDLDAAIETDLKESGYGR
jgi:hypothetical protein